MLASLLHYPAAIDVSELRIIRQLEQLIDIGIALSAEKDSSQLLEKILRGAKTLTNADGGSLFLVHNDAMRIEIFQSDTLGAFFNGCNSNFLDKPSVPLYLENGEAKAIIGYQAFNLRVKGNTPECDFNFDSKVWNAQSADKKTPFQYVSQPKLDLTSHELKQHDRKVKFNFKVDKHGQVKKVKIKQGSGIYVLDQKVVEALRNSQISVKRTASTLWIYKKSNFKDEIQFKVNGCK